MVLREKILMRRSTKKFLQTEQVEVAYGDVKGIGAFGPRQAAR